MAVPLDLPDLERQLGQLVIDALTDASLVLEAKPCLYHSEPKPGLCCPKEGGAAKLWVWWEPIGANDGCGGPLPVGIYLRQYSCWPAPDPRIGNDRPFDEHAEYLARCAWVGTAALSSLVCDGPATRAMGMARARLLPTKPRKPMGACTGIDWGLQVWPQAAGWMTAGGGS